MMRPGLPASADDASDCQASGLETRGPKQAGRRGMRARPIPLLYGTARGGDSRNYRL